MTRFVRAAAVAAVALLFALPLVFMATGALRPAGAPPPRNPLQLAWPPAWENIRTAFDLVPLGRLALNSLAVALPAAAAGTVFASWAAAAVVRSEPASRRRLTGALLVLLMVPPFALWIPRVVLFRTLGLIDTWFPLWAMALIGVTPFTALLCLWSLRRVPDDLWDMAALEGAGPVSQWWRVGVSNTAGTHAAAFVIAFAASWGAFVEPLLYLSSASKFTLPLGLQSLQQLDPTGWPIMLAGALVAAVPVVVGFALVQRRFLAAIEGARWVGH